MKLSEFGVGQFTLLVLCVLFSFVEFSSCGNVLVLVATGSKSHKNVFDPIVSSLAQRNHTVTIVSSFKPSKPQKNVREIVAYDFNKMAAAVFDKPIEKRAEGMFGMMKSGVLDSVFEACHEVYRNAEFQSLLNEKFDLIFIDAILHDCFDGVIYKMGSPFIIVTTLAVPSLTSSYVGNRLPPSFVPFFMVDYSDRMTFFERVSNMLLGLIFDAFQYYVLLPKFAAVYREHLGQDLPSVPEINKNVNMIFSNSHFSLNLPRPLLPDIVEVGGMHCKPVKPLPADIEKFVSEAKDGVILFSLGSIVLGHQMPEQTRKVFLNVFSRLKQRVIWKWETGKMDDAPPNVRIMKWLPQQDILGHPNTKVFMTHGGLLSSQEAAYYGVPLLGIPIFGDQDLNAKQAEKAGYGLTVEILDLKEEDLEEKINKLINEKRFSERAKELSTLYRDQSETPLERAIFWSEYVMRHKGAPHLRSAARDLNFFQYHSLDVLAFLLAIIVLSLWITKLVLVGIFRKIFGKKCPVDRTKKRQ